MQWQHGDVLLERIVAATGVPLAAEELRRRRATWDERRDEGLALTTKESWPHQIATFLTTLDIHPTVVLQEPVRRALSRLGEERSLLVLDTKRDTLSLIRDRGRRRLWVESSDEAQGRWLRRSALPSYFGFGDAAVDWLTLESQLPLAAVAQASTAPRRLLAWLKLEKRDLSVLLVYAIASGILALGTPIAVQALVNTVAFGTLMQPLAVLAIVLFAVLSLRAVLLGLEAWVVEVLQRRLFLRAVTDIGYRLPRVEIRTLEAGGGTEHANRVFDVFTVQKSAAALLIDGLDALLLAVVGMLLLAFYHPFLLAFDIVLLASLALIVFGIGHGATRTALEESTRKYKLVRWLQELTRYAVLFRSTNGVKLAEQRIDNLAYGYLEARQGHFRLLFRQIIGALALQVVASASLLGIGGWLVISRQLTLGQLVAAELVVSALIVSLAKLGKHLSDYYTLVAAVDKVASVASLPTEPPTPPSPWRASGGSSQTSALELRQLSFQQAERIVLQPASGILPRGHHTALLGSIGSGKTTLLRLLFGAAPPTSGAVHIDGRDLRELSPTQLRDAVALVPSEAAVFGGSLLDNLKIGSRNASLQDLRRLFDRWGLPRALPSELTQASELPLVSGGAPLSGNAARCLSLARAMLQRPRLLLVDATLDSFDATTRDAILSTLLASDVPWTLLLATNHAPIAEQCRHVWALQNATLTFSDGTRSPSDPS